MMYVTDIVPVSYLVRNMGESNLRMRHHYLGGPGTRPLAQALRVCVSDYITSAVKTKN